MGMMISCLCIGAAHVDHKLCSVDPMILGTSNPVSSHTSFGGVARNVCENLARLNVRTSLVSRIGHDADGQSVVSHLQSIGVSTDYITRSNTYPTAKYTSVIDSNGDMVVACADMSIYDEISPELLLPILRHSQEVPFWLVDTNLLLKTVQAIIEEAAAQKLWLVSVSVPKILPYRENKSLLKSFEGLSLNFEELAALLDRDYRSFDEIAEGCLELHQLGIPKILVTIGKEGVIACDHGAITHHSNKSECEVVETTGAGDAFIAGVLFGQVHEFSMEQSISHGMELAENALSSKESVSRLVEL